MSGAEEREARSVALEKAYVHEVYEQISGTQFPSDGQRGKAWPKVKQFISELEPGSLVCDVGCGNGKYLNVNPSVFKIGADRCCNLTDLAREKENEVLLCDNLALPFRDESFDAVLSIAVVHHFATTERRVGALRELARVLRIGGRLIISVWAMEQRHRKFESQDVLVPWHRPQHLSTPSLELTSTTTTTSEEDGPPPYHAYTQTSDSDSARSARPGVGQRKRGRSRHKGRSIDPSRACSSSQSSSSLSSPNETCYSFVRRALQKLAGGKRGGSGHRPWFLDSWSSCTKETPPHRYDPEGCEEGDGDIQDLPIELRRLEEDQHDPPQRRQTFACDRRTPHNDPILNHKSKSLSDILTVEQKAIVRSRSSIPSLGVTATDVEPRSPAGPSPVPSHKPRLVKQKKSVCEEEMEEEDEPSDMRDLVKALPEFKHAAGHGGGRRHGSVFKQSSMNEELMSTERLREKERVRQNIQKQASLNEELIYRRHRTLDSLRDTLFSTSTAKRFQLLKNGLTSKLKSSTTGIEKVAGTSFKNGFVRILQGWKGGEVSPNMRTSPPAPNSGDQAPPCTPPFDSKKAPNCPMTDLKPGERRPSREDGSDSSKDSSLQSDTSVDSEDSFASVIFVPKPDPPQEATSNNNGAPVTSPVLPANQQLSPPKSPQPTSPKVKQQPISPKLKQPLSPIVKTPISPTTKQQPTSPLSNQSIKRPQVPSPIAKTQPPLSPTLRPPTSPDSPLSHQPLLPLFKHQVPTIIKHQPVSPTVKSPNSRQAFFPSAKQATSPVSSLSRPSFDKVLVEEVGTIPEEGTDSVAEYKHNERLRQIQELLRSRTGSGSSRISTGISSRSVFPLVRRSSAQVVGRSETLAKPLPRLLSLELFNPETDDMDSDSSGVSSPDSVSSVISVLTEDLPGITSQPHPQETQPQLVVEDVGSTGTPADGASPLGLSPSASLLASSAERLLLDVQEAEEEVTSPGAVSPSSLSLLEAAADVATTLEETVDAVIQSSPRARRRQLQLMESTDPMAVLQGGGSTWSLHKSDSTTKMSPEDAGNKTFQSGYSTASEWSSNRYPSSNNRRIADCLSPATDPKNNNVSCWNANRLESYPSPKTEQRNADEVDQGETWDENCRQHLADFAEKLSEKLLEEIDQYRQQTSQQTHSRPTHRILTTLPEQFQHINDPYLSRLSEELEDLTKLSEELQERNSYLASFNNNAHETPSSLFFDTTIKPITTTLQRGDSFQVDPFLSPNLHRETFDKESKLDSNVVISVEELETNTSKQDNPVPNNISEYVVIISSEAKVSNGNVVNNLNHVLDACSRQTSEDISEDLERCEQETEGSSSSEAVCDGCAQEPSAPTTCPETESPARGLGGATQFKTGYSLESSDAGDVSEPTASGSDCSRRDTNSAGKTASTASLGPNSMSSDAGSERTGSDCSRDMRYADRRTARCDGRSSSEEAPPRVPMLVRQRASTQEPPEALTKTESCTSSLSGSTSQESLPSDNGGGAITFHRYYHVFREGELDQLIERYVQNLHIISSYYDHANWCVVAEKVQVWTI